MSATSSTTYTRKLPPLAVRCAMGVVLLGLGPILRLIDRLGRIPSFIAAANAGRQRRGRSNPFKNYTPTHHDVFVAAHVKSGTNWMMQIAHQLAFHGHGDYEHIHTVVAWPDVGSMGPMKNYAIPVEDPSVWMASPEQKRVIKTHFDFDWLPYSPDARYILVIRDPKDVFVSSYFFFVKNGILSFARFSVDTWFKVFLRSGVGPWSAWPVNTASYWAARHLPNVLIVPFKSMKQDLRGTVSRVARFMEVRADEDLIDRVCEKASFDYMKQIDEKFRAWEMIPWKSTAAPMMRKGTAASSSELLTTEQQRHLDQHFMAELKRLGSDFPYEEFCETSVELKASGF